MTAENCHHVACVDAWMGRAGAPGPRFDAFERALHALWTRALTTLGEITLGAIVDRVLYVASERYPLLSPLSVGTSGVCLDDIRPSVDERPSRTLQDACRFVLIELLTVIGKLTAEILTPALHAKLSSVGIGQANELADKVGA